LFITVQIKDNTGVPILQKTINSAALPIIAISKSITNFIKESVSTYFLNINAQKRNIKLQKEIAELKTKLEIKSTIEDELSDVKNMLSLTYTRDYSLIPTEVIGNSSFSGLNLMLINKGSRQNLKENQGALCENGIVGRVWKVFPGQSQVQLISDSSSGIAVYLNEAEIGGVLSGTGNLQTGLLKYISNTILVKTGDKVFTSGTDKVFPRGVLAGTIIKTKKTQGFFQEITVKFSSNLSNLKYIFVVGEDLK